MTTINNNSLLSLNQNKNKVTLTIISHTEHYLAANGTIVGLGSTVIELNHLLEVFDHINHVAMLHGTSAPANALPYVSDRIRFVAIPTVGGATVMDKFAIVKTIPKIIRILKATLQTTDYFQFRAPTGIGVFVIPYLMFLTNKKGWYKYAGNWKQPHAPLAYRFQKWLLEHQSRPVTINGFWDDQPTQCLSFENPCLTQTDLVEGNFTIKEKRFTFPINFCFVGRLEAEKGIDLLIDAISSLDIKEQKKIGVIHLVGDGNRSSYYKTRVSTMAVSFIFHGVLPRTDVQAVYKDSHAIILPSASEGFPKVIGEAMNYGCVPIVSNVSSIGHYIKDGQNGFLLSDLTSSSLQHSMSLFLELKPDVYTSMLSTYSDFVKAFTYSHYNRRLMDAVLLSLFFLFYI